MAASCAVLAAPIITLCTGTRDPQDMWRAHPLNDSPEAWKDLLASVDEALKIAERLDATLVNMRFVKPLDDALVLSLAERHSAFVTIEENSVMGGAGSAVGEVLAAAGVLIPLLQIGIPAMFVEHGSRDTCLAAAGLDAAGLSASVDRWWTPQLAGRMRSAQGA